VRAHLFERLDGNLDTSLTLISAPAGFGKTTLLTSWLDRLATRTPEQGPNVLRATWLSADPNVNDPYSFFSALLNAVEDAFPGSCGQALAWLQSSQSREWSGIADLIAQACAALPGKLVLVIDDYHLITNDVVHEAMSRLIHATGKRMHVVIATRTDPPVRLSQLRMRQQLTEIRTRDLRFDIDEAAQFMRHAMLGELPQSWSGALHRSTEGWAAGLRLAIISLQQRADADAFIHEFERNSSRYIMDYLTDEVLHGQTPELRAFLLRTSALPRMCAELCAVVTDQFDEKTCQSMLEQLERLNLFIVNLDDHRGWYRYHHQFQTLLLKHLRLELGDSDVAQLRLRATAWLADNGHLDEAIAEYARLQAFDAAAQIIEDNLEALQNDEQWPRLEAWLNHVPADTRERRPGLLIALGWIRRFQYDDAAIKPLVAAAGKLLGELEVEVDESCRSRWQAQLLALKTAPGVITNSIERADVAKSARDLAQREQIWVRVYALMNEAFSLQAMGELDRALSLLECAFEDANFAAGKCLARLHFTAAVVHFSDADMVSLQWHAQSCHDLATHHHMPMTAVWGECLMGLGHYDQHEWGQAERHFRTVFAQRFIANQQAVALTAHALVRMLAGRGELEAAQTVVNDFCIFAISKGKEACRNKLTQIGAGGLTWACETKTRSSAWRGSTTRWHR
jgi:LuxR family maltose regulon positive regulatory protein